MRVRDVGSVRLSHRMRLGQVARDQDDDVVEGIILLRKGYDTLGTCAQIRERIAALNASCLPSGVTIDPYYDRTQLIQATAVTRFFTTLLLEFCSCACSSRWDSVSLIARSSSRSRSSFHLRCWPRSVGMRLCGTTPNLISLGAVEFGIIVETAIFAAEAVILILKEKKQNNTETIVEALNSVLAPALLCALLLIVAFIPILRLQRVEGRIFKTLRITLISALVGGQLGALLFIPLFSFWVPIDHQKPSHLDGLFGKILNHCQRFGMHLKKMRRLPLYCGVGFTVVVVALVAGLGREFLPQLGEGALFIRATAPATISREAAVELGHSIRNRLKKIPEVTDVVTQIGRPDDGTDINGFDNIEFHVNLVNPNQWRSAKTINGLIDVAQSVLSDIQGVDFNFSQPIKDNVDEAISGVKGELVIKVFGRDPSSTNCSIMPMTSRRCCAKFPAPKMSLRNNCSASRNFVSR